MALITLSNDFVYNKQEHVVYMQKHLKDFERVCEDIEESTYYFSDIEHSVDEEVLIQFELNNDKPVGHEIIDLVVFGNIEDE